VPKRQLTYTTSLHPGHVHGTVSLMAGTAAAMVLAHRQRLRHHSKEALKRQLQGALGANRAEATLETPQKPLITSVLETLDGFGRPLDNPFVDGPFAPVKDEITAEALTVLAGAVPTDFPDGVYIRNGPNPRFPTVNVETPVIGQTAHHWFEGDGMLHAIYFKGGVCSYRNRYVRTKDFCLEELNGGPLYRPTVQVTPPSSLLNIVSNAQALGKSTKDVANTSVLYHGGRLLAITEGAAMPTEISLKDLSTVGPFSFGREDALPSFTAHPRIDPATGELVFAAYSFFESETGASGIHMGVVAPDGHLKHWTRVPSADRTTLMHDTAITENWTLIMDFPLMVDPSRMFTKEGMITFDQDAVARIGIMPRFGEDVTQWFEVANGYVFHFLNAYEDGEEIVVRGCRSDSMSLSFPWNDGQLDRPGFVKQYFAGNSGAEATNGAARLHEWRLHLGTGKVSERDVGVGSFVDFPMINKHYEGRPHRFGYCAAFEVTRSLAHGLPVIGSIEKYTFHTDGKVTTEQHCFPVNCNAQEVAFVPRPGAIAEDDGWLLFFVNDEASQKSELHIIDAQRFSDPPCARLELPQRVPCGFHGTFVHTEA